MVKYSYMVIRIRFVHCVQPHQKFDDSITRSLSSSRAFSLPAASPRASVAKCAWAASHCPSETALKMADSSFWRALVQRRTPCWTASDHGPSTLSPSRSMFVRSFNLWGQRSRNRRTVRSIGRIKGAWFNHVTCKCINDTITIT